MVATAVDWTALELVGALLVGLVLGIVIVLRVVRAVAHMFNLRPLRGREGSDEEDPAS